jgi:hypothetical protein
VSCVFQSATKIVDMQQTEKARSKNKEKPGLKVFYRSKYSNKIDNARGNKDVFI